MNRNLFLISKPFLLVSLILVLACNNHSKRYISPNDTRYSEDIRTISKRINKDPKNAELYYNRANVFFIEKIYGEAIADIEVAIELSPQNAFYYYKLGEYYMAGDTANAKGAEKAYIKSIELDPSQVEPHLQYAILLLAKQRYKETVEQLTAVLNINPSNSDAMFFLGMVNKETQDTAQAIKRFQETANIDNNYYNAYMQLAYLLMDSKPELALSYIDNAIRIDEFSDEAHYLKGIILEEKGEYIIAKEFYKRTIELNPQHRFAYYRLAYINAEIDKNMEKALEYLNKLLSVDPDFVPGLHFRGAVYKQVGMKNNALEDWEKAARLDPENEEIQADLADLKG
ncbi:MAG: tetratricopeptide repeat protein [Bacteroidia bacterium]|nr:tetratricopeptide repeat protein [Bacteroidia bacterium]